MWMQATGTVRPRRRDEDGSLGRQAEGVDRQQARRSQADATRQVSLFGRRQPEPTSQPGYRLARPSLTAAAQSGNPDQNRSAGKLRRLHQEWQLRALATYDTVGECWYPSQFYARSLAKTRYFPALLNDRGEPEEVEDGPLVELMDRIRDPGSAGRSELAASYGRLQFLNGDGYLTVTQDGDDEGEAWEYLSVAELRIDPNDKPGAPQRYQRLKAPGATPEDLSEAPDTQFAALSGKDVRVWRLWRSHPAHSQLADAPIRAVLDLYELLHRLTLAAGAEASSRAAQRGLLVVAEEIANQFKLGPDDDPESDPFMRAFSEALTEAIQNPGSAGALSPILLRGPGAIQTAAGVVPIKDLVAWIPLGPSTAYTEGDMWDKTIGRIGNGLDLPRQILDGEARNHWGDWLIDEQGYRQHVAPVTERFCADLASAYLRPAAKAASFADWERVVVGYDPADAILHPDQTANAFEAFDRDLVGGAFVRDKIGATDDDVPTEEEIAARTPPPPVAQDDQPGETAPQDGGTGGDVTKQPPVQNGNGNGNGAAVTASALQVAKIIGASEMVVERARELAGVRLVRRAQSCDECQEKLSPKPSSSLVASVLGAETVRGIIEGHTSEQELIGGVGATLANTLRTWGIEGEWPKQLGELVEQHALRTLYEEVPAPLPPGFAAAVAKALR